MKRMIGFRTVVWALGLSMAAVVVLLLGAAFNIWAASGLLSIPVILVLVIPLSLILFVLLVHREQEQSLSKRRDDDSSHSL